MLRDVLGRVVPRGWEEPPAWARGSTAVVALLVVLGGWVLAMPPGASPDDDYHLGSIWCADGYKDDICLEAIGIADPSVALVPAPVLELSCFAYDGARSAACQLEALSGPLPELAATVTNINGQRPSLYYRTMHLLIGSGQDVTGAAARIRTANILLTTLMVALTAFLAHRRLRSAFLLAWVVAAVPLGLFFATTVSTSAWTIAGLSTVWANTITAMDHPLRRNRISAGLLAAVGVLMGLGARTEAVAHVAILVVTLGALRWWQRRERTLRDHPGPRLPRALRVSLGLVGLAAFVWLLDVVAPESADLDGAIGGFAEGYARLEARDIGDPFLAIVFEVPTLWSGALGDAWGLGVLDTPIPSVASLPIMGLFVALAAVGLQRAAQARILAVSLLLGALVAMPTLSLLRSGLLVYESLQPRQFMAMIYPLLGIALYRLGTEPPLVLGRAMRTTIVVGMTFAHSLALLVTMQRHTNGLLPGFDAVPRHVALGREPEWWWPTLPAPEVVWAVGSIAFLVLIVSVVRRFRPEVAEAA